MKKFLISGFVVLMSVSSFAQSSEVFNSKALNALFASASTVKMVGNVDPSLTLEQLLIPVKEDLVNLMQKGILLGDNDDYQKKLSAGSMSCSPLGNSHSNCTLQMNNAQTGIGTTILFEVTAAQDGSLKLARDVVSVENDI